MDTRIGAAVVSVALLATIGCDRGEKPPEANDGDAAAPARAERSVTVDVMQVVRADLVLPVFAEGTIRARRSAEIHTEINGRIERVLVNEGDRVRAGQTIAGLDARERRVAYDEARSAYLEKLSRLAVEDDTIGAATDGAAAAEVALAAELRELERAERSGTISGEERTEREVALQVEAIRRGAYRREVVAARSGLAAARAAMERARIDLERTEISAPFAGVVSDIGVSAGEQVTVNQKVARLVDDVHLEADVGVLESDLRGLETGRAALLAVPALDDTIPLSVDVLSAEVDSDSRTCRVLMRFEGDGTVRPGMFVRAAIAGRVVPNALVVANEAVLTRDGRPLLFKLDGDRAKWVYVELGERNDQFVAILSALRGGSLESGDRVVVSGHLTLAHDATVSVRRTIEPPNPWKRD